MIQEKYLESGKFVQGMCEACARQPNSKGGSGKLEKNLYIKNIFYRNYEKF